MIWEWINLNFGIHTTAVCLLIDRFIEALPRLALWYRDINKMLLNTLGRNLPNLCFFSGWCRLFERVFFFCSVTVAMMFLFTDVDDLLSFWTCHLLVYVAVHQLVTWRCFWSTSRNIEVLVESGSASGVSWNKSNWAGFWFLAKPILF